MPRSLGDVDLAYQVSVNGRTHAVEQAVGCGRVDRQHTERLTPGRSSADLHPGDVDAGITEFLTEHRHDAGPVCVHHDHEVVRDRHLDVIAVDLDDLLDLLGPGQGSRH